MLFVYIFLMFFDHAVAYKLYTVGITFSWSSLETDIQQSLALYETIENSENWQPYLVIKDDDGHVYGSIETGGHVYRTRKNYIGLKTVIELCFSLPNNFDRLHTGIHSVRFKHSVDYFSVHSDLSKNRTNNFFDSGNTVDTLWVTPSLQWQLEFSKWGANATNAHVAPRVFKPHNTVKHNVNTNRIGVYEANANVGAMSQMPMLIVENYYKTYPVEYVESNAQSLHKSTFKMFKAPWNIVEETKPDIWARNEIGTIVTHRLNPGFDSMWLHALNSGLALVHNSEHLPCGYYYHGENITAGVYALYEAIRTHHKDANNLCLEKYATDNVKNVQAYEKLLDLTFYNPTKYAGGYLDVPEPKKPVLWTSTRNIGLIPQKSIDLWRKYTKGYELRVYDNRQTHIFMKKYAPKMSYKLFSQLQKIKLQKKNAPHAYDLWRATALFYFGGVYLDDKIQLQHQLSEIFDPEHINFMNGVAYPEQGIAIGVLAAPAKHPVLDEFIDKVVAQGLPFTNYHNYCIKMYNAVENFKGNVKYLEQTKAIDGCEHDILGACYYLKHAQLGDVGRIRPPASEYPWVNVTNATGLILSESGDYYTLSVNP